MGATMQKAAAEQLRCCIWDKKLFATPEEADAWLQTESGMHIAALIDDLRKAEKPRRKQSA